MSSGSQAPGRDEHRRFSASGYDKRIPACPLGWRATPGLGALLVRGGNAFARGAVRTCVTRAPMSKSVAVGYLEPYDSWANRIAVHRFVQDIPLKEGGPCLGDRPGHRRLARPADRTCRCSSAGA